MDNMYYLIYEENLIDIGKVNILIEMVIALVIIIHLLNY